MMKIKLKPFEKSSLLDAICMAGLHSEEPEKTVISYQKVCNKLVKNSMVITSKKDLLVCIDALYFAISKFNGDIWNRKRVSNYKKTLEFLILTKMVKYS